MASVFLWGKCVMEKKTVLMDEMRPNAVSAWIRFSANHSCLIKPCSTLPLDTCKPGEVYCMGRCRPRSQCYTACGDSSEENSCGKSVFLLLLKKISQCLSPCIHRYLEMSIFIATDVWREFVVRPAYVWVCLCVCVHVFTSMCGHISENVCANAVLLSEAKLLD